MTTSTRQPRARALRSWIWQLAGTAVALSVAFLLLDDISASSAWAVLGAAVVVGIVGAILNPLL